MDKAQLLDLLAKLNLPKGQWAAFGGACLIVRELRTSYDLDIFVTPELFKKLSDEGWEKRTTSTNNNKYLRGKIGEVTVEVFISCGDDSWPPDPAEYIKNPEVVEDMPFMPLKELYKWKAATRRPKDVIDLKLIEKYYEEL